MSKLTSRDRDWTRGSILKNLLLLSWPIIISQSLNMIGPTIDMIWVGKLGPTSMAAVGISGMVVMFVMSLLMGLSMGARALVARAIGRKDMDDAVNTARQSFVLTSVLSLTLTVLGIVFAKALLQLMGVEDDVLVQGTDYLRVMFTAAIIMAFWMLTEGIMQAAGDSITPMKINIIAKSIHVVLCPILIVGWHFIPGYGVIGAGITNVITQLIALAIGLHILLRGNSRIRLSFKNMALDLGTMKRIVRIGIPSTIMSAQRHLSHLVMMSVIVGFGTMAVAAHTLLQRVESVIFMFGVGMGMASGVLGGQNLGAKQPDRAAKGGVMACMSAEVVVIACCIVVLAWPEMIIGIFNSDPALEEIAVTFMYIGAAGFLMMGVIPVFVLFLSGVGDTMPPMIIELLSIWLVMLPLAVLLPKFTGLGVNGVRWAISISMVLEAAAYLVYFKTGKWKYKRI